MPSDQHEESEDVRKLRREIQIRALEARVSNQANRRRAESRLQKCMAQLNQLLTQTPLTS